MHYPIPAHFPAPRARCPVVPSAALLCLLIVARAGSADLDMKPYGFIKADMYYVTDGALSYFTPALTSVSVASDTGGDGLSFTSQHTRVGLKGTVRTEQVEIGGLIELDFFSIRAAVSVRPRMRLAYLWIVPVTGLDIRLGQQWDVFSPLNPVTNNTNANLWYNGNYGFRRTQFQVRCTPPLTRFRPSIQVSAGEAASDDDVFLGRDNLSGQPMWQGRVSIAALNRLDIGFSAVYAVFGESGATDVWGLCTDAVLPVHELGGRRDGIPEWLLLMGEFAYGSNLNDANLFTTVSRTQIGREVRTNGFWVNAISKPFMHLHFAAGLARENILTSVPPGVIENNTTWYADVIVPVRSYLSFIVEFQQIYTDREDRQTASTNVFDISGRLVF